MASGIYAVRQTCFAIISAIEVDLRQILASTAERAAISSFMPTDLCTTAIQRLKRDQTAGTSGQAPTDSLLLDYIDFADGARLLEVLRPHITDLAPEQIARVAEGLVCNTPLRNRVCHARPLEADDFATLHEFALALLGTDKTPSLWPTLRNAIAQLQQDPSFVLKLTIPNFWTQDSPSVAHNLPLPEFDDTGFLGRAKDRRELLRQISSSHPVISVVGEGGVGKTALTMRCLYDLVEAPEGSRFDAIVWISLKSRSLTTAGITAMKTSIADTLTLLDRLGSHIGVPDEHAGSPALLLEELRCYLAEFKLLVAIDNLETIALDQNLRQLLSNVGSGSKVVITSRIGLGELEYRFPVAPFDLQTSIMLLRRFATVVGLREIASAADSILEGYASAFYHNPLLLKWFVQQVSSGASPTALMAKSHPGVREAVRFCFENLFDRLSEDERYIVYLLACARRELTETELRYLARDRDADRVQFAIATLYRSSILRRQSRARDGEDAGTICYYLSDIALEFVTTSAPPQNEVVQNVGDQLRELDSVASMVLNATETYEFDLFAIEVHNRDERIGSADLVRAIQAFRRGDTATAKQRLNQAKQLLPNYSECYRVGGLIETEPFRAREEYERALDLNPKSVKTLYSYALFLAQTLADFEGALPKLDAALTLAPCATPIRVQKARALMVLCRTEEAAALYEECLKCLPEMARRQRIPTIDQAIDNYSRWAEQAYRQEEPTKMLSRWKRAAEIAADAIDKQDFDAGLFERFASLLTLAAKAHTLRQYPSIGQEVYKLAAFLYSRFPSTRLSVPGWDAFVASYNEDAISPTYEEVLALPIFDGPKRQVVNAPRRGVGETETARAISFIGKTLIGKAERLHEGSAGTYTFIRITSGDTFYCNLRNLQKGVAASQVRPGCKLEFVVAPGIKGAQAIRVRPVCDPLDQAKEGK